MNRCSEFLKDKALFGSYPVQESVEELEKNGVNYFVDLTHKDEKKITPYKTNVEYIRYPIQDHRVPTDWKTFACFILKLVNIIDSLSNGSKIYIHCRAGHGRSGIVVACLLCYIKNIPPSEALSLTSNYHNKRVEMRDKWRRIGSPQTRAQKHFVTKFFEPIHIYKNYTTYFSSEFYNDAPSKITIPNFGTFESVTEAFEAYKKLNTNDWEFNKDIIMFNILQHKFTQNKSIRDNILNTGLRPMIIWSDDSYWGSSKTDKNSESQIVGQNILGKLLTNLRNTLYIKSV